MNPVSGRACGFEGWQLIPTCTETDAEDAFDRATRVTLRGAFFSGNFLTVTTTVDDGHVEDTYSAGGTLYRETITDPNDVLPFAEQEARWTGSGARTSWTQLDEAGTANWERITTVTNFDGTKAERTAVYDTGRVIAQSLRTVTNGQIALTLYADGVRVSDLSTDGSGTHGWDTVRVDYDATGARAHRLAIYDDGRTVESVYDAGELALAPWHEDVFAAGTMA